MLFCAAAGLMGPEGKRVETGSVLNIPSWDLKPWDPWEEPHNKGRESKIGVMEGNFLI